MDAEIGCVRMRARLARTSNYEEQAGRRNRLVLLAKAAWAVMDQHHCVMDR